MIQQAVREVTKGVVIGGIVRIALHLVRNVATLLMGLVEEF